MRVFWNEVNNQIPSTAPPYCRSGDDVGVLGGGGGEGRAAAQAAVCAPSRWWMAWASVWLIGWPAAGPRTRGLAVEFFYPLDDFTAAIMKRGAAS
ncbi:hypothetical protein AB0I35_23410 [Nocardia sp. NPDC050378]|uniref:hypothetical protein n=1 Tax=Nocardia sp. NPDC050378 TaxID=3155400 RepID=UPI00340F5300